MTPALRHRNFRPGRGASSINQSRKTRPLDDGWAVGGLRSSLLLHLQENLGSFTATLYALLEGLVLAVSPRIL